MGTQPSGGVVGNARPGERLAWNETLRYGNEDWLQRQEVEQLLIVLCMRLGITPQMWKELQEQSLIPAQERKVGEHWWQATRVELFAQDTFTVSFATNIGKK